MKKDKKIKKIIEESQDYIYSEIYPAMVRIAENEYELLWKMDCIRGSLLMYHSAVQEFEIIEHYCLEDVNLYVIEKNKGTIYGFVIDENGFVYYASFRRKSVKKFMYSVHCFLGMPIGEIFAFQNVNDVSTLLCMFDDFFSEDGNF